MDIPLFRLNCVSCDFLKNSQAEFPDEIAEERLAAEHTARKVSSNNFFPQDSCSVMAVK